MNIKKIMLLTLVSTAIYAAQRSTEYSIEPIFTERWSSRAMSGEEISDAELMALFEAARWAPSSYNGQPWRFVYAKRDSSSWKTFFDLLVPFNQEWTKNASALVVIVSHNVYDFNNEPNKTHSFDAGAAWQNIALQGSMKGLVVHGMSGFDYKQARQKLNIPHDYTIEAMFAVGRPASADVLPKDLREQEKPSTRKPVSELVFEGTFN